MDAYAPFCLHGTLPLVRDEREPSGYRFARIGRDAPETCIGDPAGLPAGELTLRGFASGAEAAGYAAALAEHGGNAFTVLGSSPDAGAEPLLLVIRHDRERGPAATLDDAVLLTGSARPSPASWSRARVASVATEEETRRRRSLTTRWRVAQDLVRSNGDAYVTGIDEDGVEFMAMSSGASARFRLGGPPEAPFVKWSRIGHRLDDDLAYLAAEAVVASGAETAGPGSFIVRLAALSADELARAMAAERALAMAEDRLADVAGNRRLLAEIAADPAAARVLARGEAGLPILSTDPGAPAAQLSLKAGTPQIVSGSLLGRMLRYGLFAPAWGPARTTRQDPQTWCPTLYVSTKAGRLVAAGRIVEAAGLVGNLRLPRSAPASAPGDGLFQALARLGEGMPDDVRGRLGQAVEAHLPADGVTLAEAAGYGRNYSSWSPIVHGALAGILALATDGRLRRADPPRSGPGPRG